MNHKFLIVLSVAVIYNGVIYASPLNLTEGVLPEEKPPTELPVTNDHNIKIVPVDAPITPVNQKPSVPLHKSEIQIAAHPDVINKEVSVAPQVVAKNGTHDSVSKNETSVIDHKNSTLVTDGKSASQPIDNKAVPPVIVIHNASAPAELPSSVSSSTPAPAAVPVKPTMTNITITIPKTNTTANATITTTTTTTTTTTPSTISKTNKTTKVDVTTVMPNSTTDKAFVVHDVHAPVQEKHFDGPSFIGGIVLTIGLTAIGFIAFKYYKAGKIDMNYRTL